MSVFDEEITIEKLKELGFKLGDKTLYKTIKCEDFYGPEVTIFYFPNKNEENVEAIFKGTYSTTHFYDTVKDMIEMSVFIHRNKEMLKNDIANHLLFKLKYKGLIQ